MEKYEKVINTPKISHVAARNSRTRQILVGFFAEQLQQFQKSFSAQNCSFMPNKLEFYAEKTAVHCGENCSFVGGNFFETLVLFFLFTAFFF